jgi:hypothetical protein
LTFPARVPRAEAKIASVAASAALMMAVHQNACPALERGMSAAFKMWL